MAPTVATYSKKRNLLRTWGSRRRQRRFAPAPQDRNQELRAALLNPAANVSARVTLPDGGRHSNSIDEIASALLDDTGIQSNDGDASALLVKVTPELPSSRSAPTPKSGGQSALQRGFISPFTMHPVLIHAENPAVGPEPSRAGSLRQRKDACFARPVPKSPDSPLVSSEQHGANAGQASNLEPRPMLDDATAVASRANQKGTTASPVIVNADEINEKVLAMLAATDALKPKTPQAGASSAPKMSRMVPSRVLSKVSNAWDRFYSKPTTPEARARSKLRKHPSQRGGDDGPGQCAPSPQDCQAVGRPSVDSVEIRLNEGNNLNKRKVQKILGGTVAGKPGAVVCKSLRTDQATDVLSGEPSSPRHPSLTEHRRVHGRRLVSGDSTLPESPFESEVGFEHNLEDRILSTAPIGSSTPRARSRGGSVTSSTGDSAAAADNASSEIHVDLARIVVKLGDDDAARVPVRQVTLKAADSRRATKPAGQLRPEALRSRNRISYIRGCERVKKHPSPSKKDLEELELALQRNEAALRQPLLPAKDHNRLIRGRSSSIREPDPLAQPDLCSARKSRLPRPVDEPLKQRRAVRLAAPFRPATARPEDFDELL